MLQQINGRPVYDCDYANHCVNIKNLLEYNPSYAKSVGTNEFFFTDTSRNADEIKYTTADARNAAQNGNVTLVQSDNADYNKGFAARKALLGLSTKSIVKFLLTDIPSLKNYKIKFFQT